MKLYWKYSNVECILPPHNVRVDLKFDSLKLYHNDNTIGIAIKGYYQSLKNVKEYFCNIEKVSKFIRKPAEYKMSNFYFETEFDKVVLNKKQECFSVSVLPWRFYNVLVSPKENIGSSLDSTRTLHYINILEIEERLKVTIQKFRDESIYTEDDLTMYGNRYRKIVENMLKLICLAKNFMFNKNYKDDTIGKLLQQLKQHSFYYDENFEKKSDDSVASKIVESQMESSSIVEEILLNGIINVTEEMVVNLNLVSHENVCTKLGADFLEQLHSRTSSLASIVSQYVLPTYVKS
jgi:hypothetical protein